MKLYLSCCVMGDGYVTKCFDPGTREVSRGGHTMGGQERTLFLRSNARLLLADVGAERFGFVRQIETERRDDSNRSCMIHIALCGSGTEVDGIILMALRHYQDFAQAVRDMVCYDETDFGLDWERYQALSDRAAGEGCSVSREPVSLLCAEPSPEYFLKYCGMGWTKSDIALMVDNGIFVERSVGMRLYLYCTTPSMGYVLREIDSETGADMCGEEESRKRMAGELRAVLDNAGCRMALFRTGKSRCFIAKEVKSDHMNQYGQRKALCLAAESEGDEKEVRQLAFFALMNYDQFQEGLTDCVKISAGTTGWTVDKEKWQQFMKRVREASGQEPEEISGRDAAPFTFLVMDTSLKYFCSSTGLQVSEKDVAHIYGEGQLGSVRGRSAEQPDTKEHPNRKEQSDTKEAQEARREQAEEDRQEKKDRETEKARTEEKPPVRMVKSDNGKEEDRIDLLKYPAFRIGAGIFGFACIILLLAVICHWIKGVLF